ncbi:hypothetical protein CTI12_AA512640 [Artemisia annua]|uniref:Uncharacterized protein n=1 Tax=Artemisia annua TaxID=35608 RepID=A0A2U1LAQ5_ARTAN|nr:hypothetical protein CTI12_AA512640 [Artemisia annua]
MNSNKNKKPGSEQTIQDGPINLHMNQDGPIIFQKLQRKALIQGISSCMLMLQKLIQVQTLLMQSKLLRRGLRFLDLQTRKLVRNLVSSLLK